MEQLRFAGHETFACRTTWLTKGVKFVEKRGWTGFNEPDSVVDLGVGKNMTLSIRYWLQAFNIYENGGERRGCAKLFIADKQPALDPLLESTDSLWLLHYELVTSGYASIYPFFFRDFFRRKSSRHFTEGEVARSLVSWLTSKDKKIPAASSIKKDFRVLLDLYCLKMSEKSEETMTNLLTDLDLIVRTPFKSDGEAVFELNAEAADHLSSDLIAALMMKSFSSTSSIAFDTLFENLGMTLLFSREKFIQRVEQVCEEFSGRFVFKQDAGIREIQCLAPEDSYAFLTQLRNEAVPC